MAQSVKLLTLELDSGYDHMVCEIGPCIRLYAGSQSLLGILSPSLSAALLLFFCLPLSPSL